MRTAESKIGALETIADLCYEARRAGRRVALVSGRFEIMTAGVVQALEAARGEADVLIAAVRRVGAPLVGDDDRAQLVAALRVVDHVWLVDDDALDAAVARLAPDSYTASPEEAETRALLERLRP